MRFSTSAKVLNGACFQNSSRLIALLAISGFTRVIAHDDDRASRLRDDLCLEVAYALQARVASACAPPLLVLALSRIHSSAYLPPCRMFLSLRNVLSWTGVGPVPAVHAWRTPV